MSILFQHGAWGMAMDQQRSSAIAALVGMAIGVNLALAQSAVAQVTPDSTLSTTVTTPDNLNFVIDQGDTAGRNLFHSFEDFSVPTNGSAYFNNATDIQSIFSRVTGNTLSDIDGLIQTNGSANLFLLNPNGIVFGPNAELNIGGSFLGSTADRLLFEDGFEFRAADSKVSPLLSITAPMGLQYGTNPSSIIVQTRRENDAVVSGLTVPSDHTLGLIGGVVQLDGGVLQTTGGRIEMGSVGANSVVALVPIDNSYDQYEVSYDDTASFSNIRLTNDALISSQDGGDIYLRGDRIRLSQDSSIFTTTITDGAGGNIALNAQRLITLDTGAKLYTLTDGTANGGDIHLQAARGIDLSGVGYDTLLQNILLLTLQGAANLPTIPAHITTSTGGAGDGGAITASTPSFIMGNGMRLSSFTTGSGSAQPITIVAPSNLTLDQSIISSNTDSLSTGNGGDIEIVTPALLVTNGANINASALGIGIGGDVEIQADSIEVRDTRPTLPPVGLLALTTIGTTALGVGNAGDTTINTRTLLVQDGASISATSLRQINPDAGAGGSIVVNAADWITLDGVSVVEGIEGGIATTSSSNSSAGDIDVSTGRLILRNGAAIQSEAYGTARGGNVTIMAAEGIEVTGLSQYPESGTVVNSRISTAARQSELDVGLLTPFIGNTEIESTGNAGNVNITTPQLWLNNGGRITVSSKTPGDAGDLRIEVDRIRLNNGGEITGATFGGDGGRLQIRANDAITLTQQSAITSSADSSATGQSGDIQIQTGALSLIDSRIEANNLTVGGRGGNINILTQQPLTLQRSTITATTTSGDGGDLTLQIGNLLLLEGNSLLSTTAGQEGSDDSGSNRSNSSNRSNGGNGGNISIRVPLIIAPAVENNDITANAFTGNGGNITISTQGLFGLTFRDRLTANNDITASSEFGLNGTVEINNPEADPSSQILELPNALVDISQLVRPGCSLDEEQFVLAGRGGLPSSPMDLMDGDRPWLDLRNPFLQNNSEIADLATVDDQSESDPIQEATGLAIASNGTLQLVAPHGPNPALSHPTCTSLSNVR